jgi:hypothetical protein
VALTAEQIVDLFAQLRRSDVLPQPRSLSMLLDAHLVRGQLPRLNAREAGLFMTAAVDIWGRAVHSFVLCVALTRVSPLWSAIAGYYASHYAVRAVAHLHGFFAVFHRREFLEMSLAGGRYACVPTAALSNSKRREHRFYWTVVRRLPDFNGDLLFPENEEHNDESDASHRNYANYADHVHELKRIDAVGAEELRSRIETVASTALEGPLAQPSRLRFPDLANVMSVAYLRIYRFREYLDQILPTRNRLWHAAREADWFRTVVRFPPRPSPGIQTL